MDAEINDRSDMSPAPLSLAESQDPWYDESVPSLFGMGCRHVSTLSGKDYGSTSGPCQDTFSSV